MSRIVFLPVYLMALIANAVAEIVKQAFSYVCGFFFLMMLICMAVTVLNHEWEQTLLLGVLMLIGYGVLFGVVALKVVIEEFKSIMGDKINKSYVVETSFDKSIFGMTTPF